MWQGIYFEFSRSSSCKRSVVDTAKQSGECPIRDQVCCPGTIWYEYAGKCVGEYDTCDFRNTDTCPPPAIPD